MNVVARPVPGYADLYAGPSGRAKRHCRTCRAAVILRQNELRKLRRAEKRAANKEG